MVIFQFWYLFISSQHAPSYSVHVHLSVSIRRNFSENIDNKTVPYLRTKAAWLSLFWLVSPRHSSHLLKSSIVFFSTEVWGNFAPFTSPSRSQTNASAMFGDSACQLLSQTFPVCTARAVYWHAWRHFASRLLLCPSRDLLSQGLWYYL